MFDAKEIPLQHHRELNALLAFETVAARLARRAMEGEWCFGDGGRGHVR
jgi:hypothetical protein